MKNSFEYIEKNIDISKYINRKTMFEKLHQEEDSIVIQEISGDFITLVFSEKNNTFFMKNLFIFNQGKTCLDHIFERCEYDEYLKAEKFVYERI